MKNSYEVAKQLGISGQVFGQRRNRGIYPSADIQSGGRVFYSVERVKEIEEIQKVIKASENLAGRYK